jgi:hypothetical protein
MEEKESVTIVQAAKSVIINILNNKKCQIEGLDDKVVRKLYHHLSFKLLGVEYSAAYQNGWSGYTYLLSKNNKFNYGLLQKVKAFLNKENIEFSVEDKRQDKVINEELSILDNLKKYNLIPREHQEKIIEAMLSTDRGIIRAATGAGKTLCTALYTAKINKPTNIYVIGLDLLDQFYNLFSKLFNEKIGYVGNGVCDIQRINIVSIWTIGKALQLKDIVDDDEGLIEKDLIPSNRDKIIELLKNTKVHILDESHVFIWI